MHFPIERFKSLDYDSKAKAMNAWLRMKDRRAIATYLRQWGRNLHAKEAYNSAILDIRDVKYWAEKAKEIRK